MAPRVVKIRKHLELDERTGALDVQVLDVLAQVESLLRGAREIQRQILHVRGVPRQSGLARRRAAATVLKKTAGRMLDDSQALAELLRHLRRESESLHRATDSE